MTLRNAPVSGRDGKSCSLICISEKQNYFGRGGWTRHNCKRRTDLPIGQNPCSFAAAPQERRFRYRWRTI
jgi:hypothetical protein